MSAIQRSDMNSNVLQTLAYKRVLETFEPNLYFYAMGEKPVFEDGYNTVTWLKFDQLTVTPTNATLTDGLTPTDTAFNATAITASPTQYGIYVNLSDMLLKTAPVNFISGASNAVGKNIARVVDEVIQTEVMGGTNVQYSGNATARANVDTSDTFSGTDLNKAFTTLQANDAPMIDGYYVGIIHPNALYDLKEDTSATGFIEASKYAMPEGLFKGEIGALNGVRLVVSSHVQTFASTTTVYPTLIMGSGAYGTSTLQNLETFVTPAVASDSDPLAQRRKVGAKIAFVPKRLQEEAMVRVESGYSLT